jgi:Flp pilus assembly protein TadG
MALIFAIIEFGCLMSAQHRLEAASQAACRIASLPSDRPGEVDQVVRDTTARILNHPAIIRNYELRMDRGKHSGDTVVVELRLPMTAAAPDLLRVFGWKLAGRELVSRAVMRRE